MNRKLRSRRHGSARRFLLPQITPMKPYIFRLMDDLRTGRLRQVGLRRLASRPRKPVSDYAKRVKRHEFEAELDRLVEEERALLREFRRLGVHIGRVSNGEMLFPCLVDNAEAYFVWYLGHPRPGFWRFVEEETQQPIPAEWFKQFTGEVDARRRPKPR